MKKTPLEYALYLVQLRDRTENEMLKKMTQKGIDSAEIQKTIIWLKDKHFVDDERFVENYVRSKTNDERIGKRKIEQKLYQLGVSKELIGKYLSDTDPNTEYEKAKELADKWLFKKGRNEKSYEQIGRHLAGKGFEIDTIKEVLHQILK